MRSFSQIVDKAKKNISKPRLVLAPAHDVRILSLLPEISAMVKPVLIGRQRKIKEACTREGIRIHGCGIMDEHDECKAVATAVKMIQGGQAQILMQGAVDNTLFAEMVFDKKKGLQTASIISHVSVVEHEQAGRCYMITDTMINKAPTFRQKVSILENALFMAHALGISRPKVGALAALEYVNPSIQSTLDAAVLSKMGDRHQFGQAIIGGPLDIDCAVSREACKRKNVSSRVTSEVDIYLVADIESGYSFAQFLSFFGRMDMAGIIMGCACPVIANMPFSTRKAKIAEVALSCIVHESWSGDV